jgi:hypothetical protein
MAMEFNEIFTGKRVRRFEEANEGLVECLTRGGVEETPQVEQIRLRVE